jgi:hypothetical protein
MLHPQSSILYLLSSILLLSSGCNYVGALAAKLPAPPIPALYKPQKVPMVIVTENWRNPAGAAIDAEQVTRFLYDDLLRHNVAPQIDPSEVLDIKHRNPDEFRQLTIAQIGQRVGAEQVLYVNVLEMTIESAPGSPMLASKCKARVKIVDVHNGEARWPDTAEGYPINVETPMQRGNGAHDEETLKRELALESALSIGALFHESPAPQ